MSNQVPTPLNETTAPKGWHHLKMALAADFPGRLRATARMQRATLATLERKRRRR